MTRRHVRLHKERKNRAASINELGGLMSIKKVGVKAGSLAFAGAAVMTGSAHAQTSPLSTPQPLLPYVFATDRVSVDQRSRPEYESAGINMGSVVLRPTVSGGVSYTDNVYGSETQKASDGFLLLQPSLVISQDDGSVDGNSMNVVLAGHIRRYFEEKTANESGLEGAAQGTLALGGGAILTGGVGAQRTYERYDSGSVPAAALAPIRYEQLTSFVRLRTGGSRLRGTLAADMSRQHFGDAEISDTGIEIDQGYRNRTVLRGTGRLEAAFTGAASAYVETSYSNINYDEDFLTGGIPNRDGQEATVLAGGIIDAGKLRGGLGAGYTRRMFSSSTFKDFGSFAVNADLTYYASGLTTYKLSAYRRISESGSIDTSAIVSTGGSISVDHELLRYVILGARAALEKSSYEGLDRDDTVVALSADARYLVNRHLEVNLQATYIKRTSSGSTLGPEFNRLQFGLNAVGKF
jgi:hypothetical protein